MKDSVIIIFEIIIMFIKFSLMISLLLCVFLPVLPIILLAFPMVFFMEETVHWTVKPYIWYFKNVWSPIQKFIRL